MNRSSFPHGIGGIAVLFFSLMAAAAPCLPMFPVDGVLRDFYQEWGPFHLLITDYFSEYFARRHGFPMVINTSNFAGMAHPVFYGYLLYPILGAIGGGIGPNAAIRFMAAAVFLAQFALTGKAVSALGGGRPLAFTAACLVTWAIYPMTNLYNRSAVTEFFAGAFLTCVICSWFLFVHSGKLRWLNLAFFFLTAMAGTHPITLLLSSVVLGWVFILSFLPPSKLASSLASWKVAAPPILALICIAPWLYAVFLLGGHLNISNRESLIYYFSFDTLRSRFSLFPFDQRSWLLPENLVHVPHWDTQVNTPLAILFAATAVFTFRAATKQRKSAVAIAAAASMLSFGLLLWISVYPFSQAFTPDILNMVQFASRLVGLLNISLLSGLLLLIFLANADYLAAGMEKRLKPSSPWLYIMLLSLLAVSAAGLAIKLSHAMPGSFAKETKTGAGVVKARILYPIDYSTPGLYQAIAEDGERAPRKKALLGVRTGEHFGELEDASISLDKSEWVLTNLVAFPWNTVYLDGKPVPMESLGVSKNMLAVHAPAGSHVINVGFDPPPMWIVMRYISIPLFFAWALATIAVFAIKWRPPGWNW